MIFINLFWKLFCSILATKITLKSLSKSLWNHFLEKFSRKISSGSCFAPFLQLKSLWNHFQNHFEITFLGGYIFHRAISMAQPWKKWVLSKLATKKTHFSTCFKNRVYIYICTYQTFYNIHQYYEPSRCLLIAYPPTQFLGFLRFPTPLSVPGAQGIRTWRRTFMGKTLNVGSWFVRWVFD